MNRNEKQQDFVNDLRKDELTTIILKSVCMHLTIDCSAQLLITSVFMKWSCDVCVLSANEAKLTLSELKWLIHGHSVTNLTLPSDSVKCDFKEITLCKEKGLSICHGKFL